MAYCTQANRHWDNKRDFNSLSQNLHPLGNFEQLSARKLKVFVILRQEAKIPEF
jgi:hypothetical protein